MTTIATATNAIGALQLITLKMCLRTLIKVSLPLNSPIQAATNSVTPILSAMIFPSYSRETAIT